MPRVAIHPSPTPLIAPYNTVLLQKAIMRWRKYAVHNELTDNDFVQFATFIGYPHNPHHPEGGLIVNTNKEEVRRIIDLINGENGNTILKMLEARNQDE